MPWNFPFLQVSRFLVPALMASNCGLLKHSCGVTGCALAIEALIKDAGFPENVLKCIEQEANCVLGGVIPVAAGSCFINEGVKSDPALPFGGINESGYGRELSMFGIYEFLNIKTVYIK